MSDFLPLSSVSPNLSLSLSTFRIIFLAPPLRLLPLPSVVCNLPLNPSTEFLTLMIIFFTSNIYFVLFQIRLVLCSVVSYSLFTFLNPTFFYLSTYLFHTLRLILLISEVFEGLIWYFCWLLHIVLCFLIYLIFYLFVSIFFYKLIFLWT